MNKELQPVSVKTDDNYIYINQDYGAFEEDSVIRLHPEQVDLLIKWINEAKEELLETKS